MIEVNVTQESQLDKVDFNNIPFGKVFSDHMFVADYVDGQWQDMKIMPTSKISFHPSMMALHYGQSIFEGMKATRHVNGQPLLFRPEMHAERLNNSARRMSMPELPKELFLDAVRQLVRIDSNWIPKDKGSALYIRPFMFATDEFIGVRASSKYKFIIITLPVGPYYNKAVKLKVERKYVRAVHGGVGEAKTCGNYAASLLPAQLAKAEGFDQVIWMDAKEFKYVQEVGTMNLFFVFEGKKVVTPATDGAILKGITRSSIIEILKHHDYAVEERKVTIDEIFEAAANGTFVEAFGTGTAALIANIELIQDGDHKIEMTEADWDLSNRMKNYINSLRAGEIEDPYGWVETLNNVSEIAS